MHKFSVPACWQSLNNCHICVNALLPQSIPTLFFTIFNNWFHFATLSLSLWRYALFSPIIWIKNYRYKKIMLHTWFLVTYEKWKKIHEISFWKAWIYLFASPHEFYHKKSTSLNIVSEEANLHGELIIIFLAGSFSYITVEPLNSDHIC